MNNFQSLVEVHRLRKQESKFCTVVGLCFETRFCCRISRKYSTSKQANPSGGTPWESAAASQRGRRAEGWWQTVQPSSRLGQARRREGLPRPRRWRPVPAAAAEAPGKWWQQWRYRRRGRRSVQRCARLVR